MEEFLRIPHQHAIPRQGVTGRVCHSSCATRLISLARLGFSAKEGLGDHDTALAPKTLWRSRNLRPCQVVLPSTSRNVYMTLAKGESPCRAHLCTVLAGDVI
jgi:hypothetical protein